MEKTIKGIRIKRGVTRGKPLHFFVDGESVLGYEGETIASALLTAGIFTSRTIDQKQMGVYCNMGVCHSCVMTVNGIPNVRICTTPVTEGCRVESQSFYKRGWDDQDI
jgi:predicted molibdopterin-dependent oxidoreductase YjgC